MTGRILCDSTEHIIFDLRNSSGGHLLAVQEFIPLFTKSEEDIFVTCRLDGKNEKYHGLKQPSVEPISWRNRLMFYIMVNENTSTLAEGFSEIMRTKFDAKVFGCKTAGDAFTRNFSMWNFEEENRSFMNMLIFKNGLIKFSDGSSWSDKGVVVDYKIDIIENERNYGDPANDRWLQTIMNKITK